MSEIVIEGRRLTKAFAGGVTAVKDLDLAVKRGAVYGLIGRNGSGKTTALRLLFGLLQATSGTARILGWDIWKAPRSVRQRAAYISQAQRLPGRMTLEELCRCQKLCNPRWDQNHADHLHEIWDVPWKRAVGSLSHGEQRRAALLLAFAARPEILVLDEPAAGFDPVARRDLAAQILEALTQNEGCTVLLSTHTIGDLERMADYIGIVDRGRMVLSTPLEDLLNQTKRVQVIFEGETTPANFHVPGALKTHRAGAVVNAIVRWPNGSELEALRASTDARVQMFPIGLEEFFTELFGNNNRDNIELTTDQFIHEIG